MSALPMQRSGKNLSVIPLEKMPIMNSDIVTATDGYLAWLKRQTLLVPADLQVKRSKMAEDPFQFLRATYYRWAELFPACCPELAGTPELLAVGDLHVQNFGTWIDLEGRLVWGINDFDEADTLPFTSDLVRLAVSAHLAIEFAEGVDFRESEVDEAILAGYMEAIHSQGHPFVLARGHEWLLELAENALKKPDKFWKKWLSEKSRPLENPESIPVDARAALTAALVELPDLDPDQIQWRIQGVEPKGLGSLGRERFFAYVREWKGGPLAREAKAAVPPASVSLRKMPGSPIFFPELLRKAVRSSDPFYELRGKWTLRPVTATAGRIDFEDVDGGVQETRLLSAMGTETANIHLGSLSKPDEHDRFKSVLQKLPGNWLQKAAAKMKKEVLEDFNQWRQHMNKSILPDL